MSLLGGLGFAQKSWPVIAPHSWLADLPRLRPGVPRLIELDDEVCSQVLSSSEEVPEALMRGALPCPPGTATNFAAYAVPPAMAQRVPRLLVVAPCIVLSQGIIF